MTFTQWPSKPLRSQQKISSRKSTLRTSSVSRTALGVRHPKFWGNDQTYFPGVDRIQTILVLLKSIYVQVDLKFELMVIHSHRTKQGWPSQSTTTEFKIRSFLKNEVLKCWRSYKYHVHLPFIYIYISFRVQPQKNQLLCRCAMFFLMLMVACWKAAQIPHQHQLIWDPNHR